MLLKRIHFKLLIKLKLIMKFFDLSHFKENCPTEAKNHFNLILKRLENIEKKINKIEKKIK